MGVTFCFIQLLMDDLLVSNIKKLITADPGVDRTADAEWLNNFAGKGFPQECEVPPRVRGRLFSTGTGRVTSSRRDPADIARQRAETIINRHKPDTLPSAVRQKIREIILEAEEKSKG